MTAHRAAMQNWKCVEHVKSRGLIRSYQEEEKDKSSIDRRSKKA
jgi:hypothetical protein